MKCKLRAVKMHRLTLDGSQMNGCFLIKCGTFVIVLKLIVTFFFFCSCLMQGTDGRLMSSFGAIHKGRALQIF